MITTDGSALSDGLGPLPDARRPDEHGMGWFTAGQMYAYGRAAYALGARSTAAQPLPESAEWEMREDGKLVRKDRWQTGMRRIVALLWGNRHEFEVDEVVEAVRALCPAPYNDGDDEGLVRAILAAAPPAAAQPVEPTVTPTEAVVGFASWVTCRPGTLPAGEGHDAAPWSEAVHEFVVAQGWPTVRDVFPHNLKRPPLSAPPAASGDLTPPSAPVQGDPSGALRPEPEAAGQDLSAGTIEQVREAMRDMLSGWQYIRSFHGDLYGVGWDRAQDKVVAALALLPPPAASQQADREAE